MSDQIPTLIYRRDRLRSVLVLTTILCRYQPASEELLIKAFQVLDEDHKSHLTPEDLKRFMMEEGEAFSQEELDEMLTAAKDPDRGIIFYKDFVTLMLPEQEHT